MASTEDIKGVTETLNNTSIEDKKPKKEKKVKEEKVVEVVEEVRSAPSLETYENGQFGDLKMIQSKYKTNRVWYDLKQIEPSNANKDVWLRARIHSVRAKGKSCFVVLRQGVCTAQALMFAGDEVPVEMVKYAGKLPSESVVDIYGSLVLANKPIESVSQSLVEIQIKKIYAVSISTNRLPFSVTDASRSDKEIADAEAKGDKMVTVAQETRLDNRVMDLRTPANNAIFKIQSAVSHYFRDYFFKNGFVEIHSPKLIPGVSEGGANVFKLGYFGNDACLAQSPQLYKQMSVLGDLSRVFEVGAVFRAEDSNTNRHLTEFTGLDFEMEIKEHYHEVLDALGDCLIHVFDSLNAHFANELAIIGKQYPYEPLQYPRKTLVIHFPEAVQMIRDSGMAMGDFDDFSTPQEKHLGKLVKEKYNTDFYIVDMYPLSVRPFYTMPHPEDPRYSNSYDVFIRGEEITSGAQRLHDYNLLIQRAIECKIPIETLQSYLDAFKYGAQPHGGAGIGLERVVMLFLALNNIRKSSLFPRDPKRCNP